MSREYYIHNVPFFVINDVQEQVSLPHLCADLEEFISPSLLRNIDVFYIGDFKELKGRNAAYTDGAIYISNQELTNEDIVENVMHELAHSLEESFSNHIYDADLVSEFRAKRDTLRNVLNSHGYRASASYYDDLQYNKKFDHFLSSTVGYPVLLSLTMGLFASPYGATSLQEYFANGFEKYFLDGPETIRKISPILHRKIEEILDATA
tara:strand:- start:692 stop:1315 length:624 start_codon:yes stop_codon:yes gene_type:complete